MNRKRFMGAAAVGIVAAAIGMVGLALADDLPGSAANQPVPPAAQAAQPDAASDARLWLHQAMTELSAGRKHEATERLERAETDLLNRKVVELGTAVDPKQPIPKSPALENIDKARSSLHANQLTAARDSAAKAEQAVSAESGGPAE